MITSSLLVALLIIPATTAKANIRFFSNVLRNCQHYNVSGEALQFYLEGQGTGNLTFHLTLPSRRNNIEEVIMAGYLSTAYAIKRTGLKVKTVYVTAMITNDDNALKVSRTDATLLHALSSNYHSTPAGPYGLVIVLFPPAN
jgi:hypothetical protein